MRCGHEDAPAYVHRQHVEYHDCLLDDRAGEDRLEDVPKRPELARVVCVAACRMTNREAILRLSVNTGDGPAMTSLPHNNPKATSPPIPRYFRVLPVAD